LVAGAAATYHVIKRIPIPGDSGWDTSQPIRKSTPVCSAWYRVGRDRFGFRRKRSAKITGQQDLHGVAVARELGRGFLDATDPGSVIIFDLKTSP